MTNDKPTPQFAPMPPRAMADTELTAADFRVLMAVCRYARFGGNGSGCYASNQTIADAVGVHEKTVSRCYAKLEQLGYLERRKSANDSRRFHRFVLWDEDVAAVEESNEAATYLETIGNASVTENSHLGNECGYHKEMESNSNNRSRETQKKFGTSRPVTNREVPGWMLDFNEALKRDHIQLPSGRTFDSLLGELRRLWRQKVITAADAATAVFHSFDQRGCDDKIPRTRKLLSDIAYDAATHLQTQVYVEELMDELPEWAGLLDGD